MRKANSHKNLQSAMEYLMTYGWSILVIAVVLAALYVLGVFSSANFAPKVQPGACQVYRPSGVYSSQNINLEGVCNSELPEYVAQFNGQNADVAMGQMTMDTGTSPVTYTIWFKPLSLTVPYPFTFGDDLGASTQGYDLYVGGPGSSITGQLRAERKWGSSYSAVETSFTLSLDTWYFGTVVYDGSKLYLYMNGTLIGSTSSSGSIVPNNGMYLAYTGGSSYSNYQLADFQAYNTSLDANTIMALYQEGIGGAPLSLAHLVSWWPLNGNSNDYGGNYDNGVATNVIYTNGWISGYTTP